MHGQQYIKKKYEEDVPCEYSITSAPQLQWYHDGHGEVQNM